MAVEEEEEERRAFPILTIEEATADGHAFVGDESISEEVAATPVKKARARPLSEQLLGRSRPKPMHEDDEGVFCFRFFCLPAMFCCGGGVLWLLCVLRPLCSFKIFRALIRTGPLFVFPDTNSCLPTPEIDAGVLSILDAATNDLALLINNLDLQATPSTPGDRTPRSARRPTSRLPVLVPSSTPLAKSNASAKTNANAPSSQSKARGSIACDSPLKSANNNAKKGAAQQLATMSSVSSLRPYAQSRGYVKPKTRVACRRRCAPLLPAAPIVVSSSLSSSKVTSNANANANAARIAQQIAPWAVLTQGAVTRQRNRARAQRQSHCRGAAQRVLFITPLRVLFITPPAERIPITPAKRIHLVRQLLRGRDLPPGAQAHHDARARARSRAGLPAAAPRRAALAAHLAPRDDDDGRGARRRRCCAR